MTNTVMNGAELNPESWVDLYGDDLFRYAYSRLKNKNLAEDFVQETFLSAFKNIESFAGRSNFKTWLVSILKNKIIDYYRSAVSKEDLTDFSAGDWSNDFSQIGIWQVWVSDWAKRPDQLLEQSDFIKFLKECYDLLTERSKLLIDLNINGNKDTEEICKELQTTATNYWVWLHRARMQLRKCIDGKI